MTRRAWQPLEDPKASVLLPAFNAEEHLPNAIDGILCQTFDDFELVVIDDGSEDGTFDIAKYYAERDPRVVVVQCGTNGGIAKALNQGIDLARGEYIARMDADDWSHPRRLEHQIGFMDAHPEVDICGGAIEVCDSKLRPMNIRTYPLTDEAIRSRLFRFSPFAHPVVVYRTSAARAVGGYNPALSPADDYDFYLRLGTVGQFANLPDLLHRYRTARTSSSQRNGRSTERLTSYIQLKAAVEYGYAMSRPDLLYVALQYASSYIIPSRIKYWLFNHLRSWLIR